MKIRFQLQVRVHLFLWQIRYRIILNRIYMVINICIFIIPVHLFIFINSFVNVKSHRSTMYSYWIQGNQEQNKTETNKQTDELKDAFLLYLEIISYFCILTFISTSCWIKKFKRESIANITQRINPYIMSHDLTFN